MQDLIRPDPSISPREIFARMQGAWLEPRQGSMWQENTGVTATTSGGQTIGKLVDLSAGRVAAQATAANSPTLQYNGNLPLIRFNSNNVLTASLPAINVRRNLLTYSEQFYNAAWTLEGGTVRPNSILGPYDLATTLVQNLGSSTLIRRSLLSLSLLNKPVSVSILVKKSNYRYVRLRWYNEGSIGAIQTVPVLDLDTGTAIDFITGLPLSSIYVTTLTNGFYRLTGIITPTNSNFGFRIDLCTSAGNSYTSDGVSSVYCAGAQVELGSVATDYQKITDWTSEAYSSSGSTYFATPQGMSCLHNQSIGTSYNLPALQTDNYCTVITPARLPPPLEQRLALYMHRLAGLSDADFFWQEQATDGMTGQLLADDNDTILLRA